MLRMSNSDAAALDIRGLHVSRGRRRVLHDITMRVRPGSLVGLLGPSGGGKTTLMRSIVGVQLGVSGTIEVLGLAAGHRELRGRIGYMTQSPSTYDDLTVRQNLEYFRAMVGAPRGDAMRVIDAVELREHAGRLVGSLSGGQRSRVSLAIALLGAPRLLVLDEPTVGLDPVLRVELWQLFHRLAAQGTTLLVSSHVMEEASRCDSLVLLRDGRVLAEDTPEGILAATGAADTEGAFLALIARAGEHEPAKHAGPRHPNRRGKGAP